MQANLSGNDKDALDAYERDFIGRFAHSSNAIEGSALSPIETQLVLEGRHEVAKRPPPGRGAVVSGGHLYFPRGSGVWRSLVAHLLWEKRATSLNPIDRITKQQVTGLL